MLEGRLKVIQALRESLAFPYLRKNIKRVKNEMEDIKESEIG